VGKPSLNAAQPYAKAEGRVFLLVPAYPGCPGTKAVKRWLLLLFSLWSENQNTCRVFTMHRCRHSKAPQYLVDCCTPVTDVVGRQRLRSATQQLVVLPRHRLSTVGRRAFAVHGPMVWNSLPDDLRARQDYEFFRQGLKTWLFSGY